MSSISFSNAEDSAANLRQLPNNNILAELDIMMNQEQVQQFYGSR